MPSRCVSVCASEDRVKSREASEEHEIDSLRQEYPRGGKRCLGVGLAVTLKTADPLRSGKVGWSSTGKPSTSRYKRHWQNRALT